jgi:transcriptional regulator of acetoin/glycerol metabolism
MVEAARDPQFLPGCLCSERAVGTNAIGTALAVDHAVQVFSAEHFNRRLHGWTTAAAPLRDPETSRLLGAVALAGLFRRAHPHTLALVTAAERLVAAHLAEDRARHDRMLQARYLDLVPGHGRGEARSSDATGGYSPLHRPAGLAIGSTSAPAS